MKLVFEEGELESIRKSISALTSIDAPVHIGSLFPVDDPNGTEYSVNFQVTDAALAQYVLYGLLHDRLPEVDLGIRITSINMSPLTDKVVLDRAIAALTAQLGNGGY